MLAAPATATGDQASRVSRGPFIAVGPSACLVHSLLDITAGVLPQASTLEFVMLTLQIRRRR
jgi:hypothetical protein